MGIGIANILASNSSNSGDLNFWVKISGDSQRSTILRKETKGRGEGCAGEDEPIWNLMVGNADKKSSIT